jgi:hypothetical protein
VKDYKAEMDFQQLSLDLHDFAGIAMEKLNDKKFKKERSKILRKITRNKNLWEKARKKLIIGKDAKV